MASRPSRLTENKTSYRLNFSSNFYWGLIVYSPQSQASYPHFNGILKWVKTYFPADCFRSLKDAPAAAALAQSLEQAEGNHAADRRPVVPENETADPAEPHPPDAAA